MTRRNAFGTVLLTLGMMAVALGVAPSDACAQFGGNDFPSDWYGWVNGDFLVPDGFGSGYDYGGPFNDGLTWSPWGDEDDGDEDHPWDGDPDYDGPNGAGRASEERAVGGQGIWRSQARDAQEAARILNIIRSH